VEYNSFVFLVAFSFLIFSLAYLSTILFAFFASLSFICFFFCSFLFLTRFFPFISIPLNSPVSLKPILCIFYPYLKYDNIPRGLRDKDLASATGDGGEARTQLLDRMDCARARIKMNKAAMSRRQKLGEKKNSERRIDGDNVVA
jgi:hypothetical protein